MRKKRVALSSSVSLPPEANAVAAPPPPAGYGDISAIAHYLGLSPDTVDDLIDKKVLPKGVSLTGTSKRIWKFKTIDAAFEKARRSRRPKPALKGMFKQGTQHQTKNKEARRRQRPTGKERPAQGGASVEIQSLRE
jgi:hypothetical protein